MIAENSLYRALGITMVGTPTMQTGEGEAGSDGVEFQEMQRPRGGGGGRERGGR